MPHAAPLCRIALVLAAAAGAQTETPLRVTIISVSDFSDPAFNERNPPKLAQSIKDATQGLTDYFVKFHHVRPTVLTGVEQTSASALRSYFNTEYPSADGPVVQLVFLLSHGFPHVYTGNVASRSELFIATSDTTDKNYTGTALKGTELISALANLPVGSSVFLFLDTCYSGAIANPHIDGMLAGKKRRDVMRFMVLASSSPDQASYSARLSRALLKLWSAADGSGVCPSGDSQIRESVQREINALDPGAPPQTVEMPSSYAPEFCLQSFAADKALALVYNPYREPFNINFRRFSRPTSAGASYVEANDVKPLAFDRDIYNITFGPRLAGSRTKLPEAEMDLKTRSVVFYELGPQKNPKLLGEAKLRAAQMAEAFGAPESESRQLAMEGDVALARAGFDAGSVEPGARNTEYVLAVNYAALADVKRSYRLAYLNRKIRENDAAPLAVASLLSAAGDYRSAAALCTRQMRTRSWDPALGICAASNRWLSRDRAGAVRVAGMIGNPAKGSARCADAACEREVDSYQDTVRSFRRKRVSAVDPVAYSYFSQTAKWLGSFIHPPLVYGSKRPDSSPAVETLTSAQAQALAIRTVPAALPALARMARLTRTVNVEIQIDASGRVTAARALTGVRLLRPEAVAAARQWVFRPVTDADRKPQPAKAIIEVPFK